MPLMSEPVSLKLGGRDLKVRPLKWKRLIPMKRALVEMLKTLDKSANFGALFAELGKEKPDADKVITSLGDAFDVLMEQIPGVLKLAIPDLDVKVFDEVTPDDESPDLVQVINAFQAVFEANHIEILTKNLLGGGAKEPTTPSSPS